MARLEPDARLYAIVPREYVVSDRARELAEAVIHSGADRYSIRTPWPLLKWIVHLRRERFDAVAVLFDSPRLMLLAAAAHARTVLYLRPNGTSGRLPMSPVGAAALSAGRRLRGSGTYAILWALIRLCTAATGPDGGGRQPH